MDAVYSIRLRLQKIQFFVNGYAESLLAIQSDKIQWHANIADTIIFQ